MSRPQRRDEKGASLVPATGTLNAGSETSGPAAPAPAPSRRATAKKVSDFEPFSSYLPAELKREFKVLCAARDVEMRDALTSAVQAWVNRHKASQQN